MDIKLSTNIMKLIKRIGDRTEPVETIIPYFPQKASWRDMPASPEYFPRVCPEDEGISSAYIASFLRELEKDPTLDMHTVTLLRHGRVIAQCAFGAYRTDIWQAMFSLTKSVTGLAIGMLIDEGKLSLDDKLIKIFEKRVPPLSLITFKNITIRHLITMSAGVIFNEAGSVTETDWVRGFLEASVLSEPGKEFMYNSMNSYMLAAVVNEITGQSLTEYLKPRLFEPMGIIRYSWEKCPKGIEKGGWGLYLLPEDMAKLGQLYMQDGLWEGKQLVSAKWIKEATSPKMKTPESYGDFNYGYHVWVGRTLNTFLLNGMFGQNVLGFRDSGILIATTAGNSETFQQSNYFSIAEKYFGSAFRPADRLKPDRAASRMLTSLCASFADSAPVKKKTPFIARLFGLDTSGGESFRVLDGKKLEIEGKYSRNVGLMPLMLQVIQNNYTQGLDSISFFVKDGKLIMRLAEGSVSYRLPVSFGAPDYVTLNFNGESYIAAAKGVFTKNEDDVPVLKIRVSFPECGNSRIIKIFFGDNVGRVRFTETPGVEFVQKNAESIVGSLPQQKLVNALVSRVDTDYLTYQVKNAFEPEMTAHIAMLQ